MISTPLSFAAPKESGKEKELFRVRGANGSSRSLRPVGAVTRPRKPAPTGLLRSETDAPQKKLSVKSTLKYIVAENKILI